MEPVPTAAQAYAAHAFPIPTSAPAAPVAVPVSPPRPVPAGPPAPMPVPHDAPAPAPIPIPAAPARRLRPTRRYGLEEDLRTPALAPEAPTCAADAAFSVVLYAPPGGFDAFQRPVFAGACAEVQGHVTFDPSDVHHVSIAISAWASAKDPDAGVGRTGSRRYLRKLMFSVQETFGPEEFVPWHAHDVARTAPSVPALADLPFNLSFPHGVSTDAYGEGQLARAALPPSFLALDKDDDLERDPHTNPKHSLNQAQSSKQGQAQGGGQRRKRLASLSMLKRNFDRPADQSDLLGVWYSVVITLVRPAGRKEHAGDTIQLPVVFLGEPGPAARGPTSLPPMPTLEPGVPIAPGWSVTSHKTRWAAPCASSSWSVLPPEVSVELHMPQAPLVVGAAMPCLVVLRPEVSEQLPGYPTRVARGFPSPPPSTIEGGERLPFLRRFGRRRERPGSDESTSSSLEHHGYSYSTYGKRRVIEDLSSHVALTLIQILQSDESNVQSGARPPRLHVLARAELSELSCSAGGRVLAGHLTVPPTTTPSFRCAAVVLEHAVKLDLLSPYKVAKHAENADRCASLSTHSDESTDHLASFAHNFRLTKSQGTISVDCKVQR